MSVLRSYLPVLALYGVVLVGAYVISRPLTQNPTAPSEAFGEPFPATITLHGTRDPFAALGTVEMLNPSQFRLDTAIVPTARAGPLINQSGLVATATIGPDGLVEVASVPATGTYVGILSRSNAGAPSTKLADLSLTVNDDPLLPLLVLNSAIALAFGAEYWFSTVAPRLALKTRLAELVDDSQRESERSRGEIANRRDWRGSNRDPVSLVTDDGKTGLLATIRLDAIQDFDRTPNASLRESRWGNQGTELQNIRSHLTAQRIANDVGITANDTFIELRRLLNPWDARFASSPLATKAPATLSGQLFRDVESLVAETQRRSAWSEQIEKACELARVLERLQPKLPGENINELTPLWIRLADMQRGDLAEIATISADAQDLWERSIPTAAAEMVAMETFSADADSLAWAFQSLSGVDTGGGPEVPHAVVPPGAEQIRQMRLGNIVFVCTALTFVFFAAFGSQYLSNPSFGSIADYAALFGWAFTAAALAQLARYIAVLGIAGRAPAQPNADAWG